MRNVRQTISSAAKQAAINHRWFFCVFLVFAALITTPFSGSAEIDGKKMLEAQLQALYLYNFSNFIKWPGQDSQNKNKALKIGVIGDAAINQALEALKEKVAGNTTVLEIVHYGDYNSETDYRDCRIVFVSRSEKANFKKITEALANSPVLTVSDSEDFINSGGIIGLIKVDNRLRFQINRSAAFLAGLHLSSQLLNTAVSVH